MMKKTKIFASTELTEKNNTEILFNLIPQIKGGKIDPLLMDNDIFKKVCDVGDFKGTENDELILYDQNSDSVHPKRKAYFGLGKIEKIKDDDFCESIRLTGGKVAKVCKKLKISKICIKIPDLKKKDTHQFITSLIEGIELGSYDFDKYKSKKDKDKKGFKGIDEIVVLVNDNEKKFKKEIDKASIYSAATLKARDMANEPGNKWTADSFASYGKSLGKKYGLTCKIYDKQELKKMKMGGILAVNQGSSTPPKLVVVEHFVSNDVKTIVLVGKGLTFDSGGISLKPASGMEDMKYDMCGGAAVLATMQGIGQLKPKNVNVIGIVPTTDNMPGGSALKPGDIVYHYNGVSSEIINTDAEGRLILADALAFGIKQYKPSCIIDLATLTGAVIIGLGHHTTGVMSNSDRLVKKIIKAGEKAGEPLWRLPLGKNYRKQIESKVADIKNTGGRAAGTVTAAEYLHTFVGKTSWAHLDIAGTAWNFTEKSYIPSGGASGTGVRTLLRFIEEYT